MSFSFLISTFFLSNLFCATISKSDNKSLCSHWPNFRLHDYSDSVKKLWGLDDMAISSHYSYDIIIVSLVYADDPMGKKLSIQYNKLASDLTRFGIRRKIVLINNYIPYQCTLNDCVSNCEQKLGNCYLNDTRVSRKSWQQNVVLNKEISLLQDTKSENVWNLFNGTANDIFMYDHNGLLLAYLAKNKSASYFTSSINNDILSDIGYASVYGMAILVGTTSLGSIEKHAGGGLKSCYHMSHTSTISTVKADSNSTSATGLISLIGSASAKEMFSYLYKILLLAVAISIGIALCPIMSHILNHCDWLSTRPGDHRHNARFVELGTMNDEIDNDEDNDDDDDRQDPDMDGELHGILSGIRNA